MKSRASDFHSPGEKIEAFAGMIGEILIQQGLSIEQDLYLTFFLSPSLSEKTFSVSGRIVASL